MIRGIIEELKEPEIRSMLLEIAKDLLPGALVVLGVAALVITFIVKAVKRRRNRRPQNHIPTT
jgi:hypothetical protein